MAGILVIIQAGICAGAVIDNLCFLEISTRVKADADCHALPGLATGIAEQNKILCPFRQQCTIFQLVKLHTKERCVAADTLFFLKIRIGGKLTVGFAVIMGNSQIALTVGKIGPGIIENTAVTALDQCAFAGAQLNTAGGLPSRAVIIRVNSVIVDTITDLHPIGVFADDDSGRAEESAGMMAVAQLDAVTAAVGKAGDGVGFSVAMVKKNGLDMVLFFCEGFTVVGGNNSAWAGEDAFALRFTEDFCFFCSCWAISSGV